MLRSMYSGVAGLQVHQTKMDVIGNNISNVNTIGFKTSFVNFADALYQTSQSASPATNTSGGKNAMQIGLGASVASISSNVDTQGGAQRTDNALDLMINGKAFFVVQQNGTNYFTKNGAFTIDGNGNLSTENGALVMGWQVDKTTNTVAASAVSSLKIFAPENMYVPPEATTEEYFSGNIDQTDEDLIKGKAVQMEFYDTLGEKYTAKYTLKTNVDDSDETNNVYDFTLEDVVDSKGTSITMDDVDSVQLTFDKGTGKLTDESTKAIQLTIEPNDAGNFKDINIDFSSMTMFANDGISTMTSTRGNKDTGTGAGATVGELSGVSVSNNGEVYGSYNNDNTKLLGQIAVATFSNPSGLEAIGNSMYTTSLNSGDFDGIGVDISSTGGKFTTGVLEMSNVDLSTEFTNMVTTQRGYQANSRVITTSDTLLEELLSLKR